MMTIISYCGTSCKRPSGLNGNPTDRAFAPNIDPVGCTQISFWPPKEYDLISLPGF